MVGPWHVGLAVRLLPRLHPTRARRRLVEGIGRKALRQTQLPPAQPELVKRQQPRPAPEIAEGVHVAFARLAPSGKLDPKLESALRLADEFGLVDPEAAIEQADLRDHRLPHADCPDRIGFDQRDAAPGQFG